MRPRKRRLYKKQRGRDDGRTDARSGNGDGNMGEVRFSASDLACDDGYGSRWSVEETEPEPVLEVEEVHSNNAVDLYQDEDLEDDYAPPAKAPPVSNFGDIVVKDSSDVHIGNKTFYNGTVTIKQFVISKDEDKLSHLGTIDRSNSQLCDTPKDEDNPKELNKLRYLKSPYMIGGVLLLLLATTLLTVFLLNNNSGKSEDPPLPANSTLRIVRRSEWKASNPARASSPIETVPAPYVIIEQTGKNSCPRGNRSCSTEVKTLQGGMIYNYYYDIQYNFLVGGDNLIYEGVGWYKAGYNAEYLNTKAISIALIGEFDTHPPPQNQINAALNLIQEGVIVGRIAKDYKLLYIKEAVPAQNGGAKLAALVTTWPHWSGCDPECKSLANQKNKNMPR